MSSMTSALAGGALGALGAYGESRDTARRMEGARKNALREAHNKAAAERARHGRAGSALAASYGARGVDVNVGAPLEVLARTEAEGDVAALEALYEGEAASAAWKARQREAARKRGPDVFDPRNMFTGMGGRLL